MRRISNNNNGKKSTIDTDNTIGQNICKTLLGLSKSTNNINNDIILNLYYFPVMLMLFVK